MKTRIYSIYSGLISFFLTLLGFTACDFNGGVEYESPHASYKINGKVVTGDTDKKPIKNIRVVMIQDIDETKYPDIQGDTVFTNNEGYFEIKAETFPIYKYKVKLQDGDSNGLFEDKIEVIEFKKSDFKGGSGWYEGEVKKDMGTIEMKFKEKTE